MIKATSDDAYRRLIAKIVEFYAQALFNPHWGEQIASLGPGVVAISMVFQGLDRQQAEAIWRPFFDWVAASPQDFAIVSGAADRRPAGRHFWDPAMLKLVPGVVIADDRPGAPADNIFWAGNLGEAGAVWYAYQSAWLPASLLETDRRQDLADALFAAAKHWGVALHFNKGLGRRAGGAIAAARDTAMNPAVVDAFALAISAAGGEPAYPGVPGHEPDVAAAREPGRRGRGDDERTAQAAAERRAPMCGRPTTSSRTGRTPSGARTTRGFARSRTNTIPTACSSSTTASAARAGARTGSRG